MCGIMSGVGTNNIVKIVLNGLKRLEYRGYDSSGISYVDNGEIKTKKFVGKVQNLINECENFNSNIVISHTRWATHGSANTNNAHPHSSNLSSWVHNGIINNHSKLRNKLENEGFKFNSETDSEVLGFLFDLELQKLNDPILALQKCCAQLEGSYSWILINKNIPDKIFFATQDSPLIFGKSDIGCFLASDPLALIEVSSEFSCIPSGCIGCCSNSEKQVVNAKTLSKVDLIPEHLNIKNKNNESLKYKHHMLSEIFEQPETTSKVLKRFWQNSELNKEFSNIIKKIPNNIQLLQLLGCGSSYYSALIAEHWFDNWSNLLIKADIASENRLLKQNHKIPTAIVAISQSGETADTLAAFNERNCITKISICNTPHSSMARASNILLPILAGQEIGVASTKAFTNQLMVLMLLAYSYSEKKDLSQAISKIPEKIAETLKLDSQIKNIATKLSKEQKLIFLGRGILYPVALEGALKLRELSYIHAQAYPAGELKHGTIALVDEDLMSIGLINNDGQRLKSIANLREVQARHGRLTVFCQGNTDDFKNLDIEHLIQLPEFEPILSPFVFTVALQLLAYHVANHLGTDVDQPRNLAKSVTVE